MSWQLLGNLDKTKHVEALTASPQQGYGEEESKAAIEVAVQALRNIVDSGVLGEGEFSVISSGHSNPGGEPDPGYSTDYISISLYKK